MKNFRIGQFVKVAETNDNENYNGFRGSKLKIVESARNTKEHPLYDDTMDGMPLFTLIDVKTKERVDCCLYQYELEAWN